MGGSTSAPEADPAIGRAATMSAQTGQDMLEFMKSQSKITNGWAAEDRARDLQTFRPLQDAFIADAQTWDSPDRQNAQANAATADVNLSARTQGEAMQRQFAGMGVNPNSGRFMATQGRMATDTALAGAGAANLARRQVRAEGDAKKAQAINLGMGLAVNPGQSMQLTNSAAGAGFDGAQRGFSQQGSLLNAQYQNQMEAWKANQGALGGLMQGLGTLGGYAIMASSKDYKTDKKPAVDSLGAMRKMPVEEWTYKQGIADEQRHIGPYAEDFHAATGKGDGKSIPMQDAIGVTMGSVKELDKTVQKLAAKVEALGATRRAA